ncbi:hypothetical protein [Microvirga sp. Mcv34]|uniref:hypothetical protein n=1 Tax=Microvirga sp. Mcv34 TaxID=2926016 RepID=UPI0021C98BEF|nr:hypothetical protein [Microvirga sp. Mcv34]
MDAAGRATYQRISWDNGTFTDTSWDYGATNWSYIQTAIDTAGRATSQRVQYDDGSFIDYSWDYTAYELSHSQVNYDAASRRTSQTALYDNGTKKVWAWDYTSGVAWTDYRIDYDTAGRQTYRVNNYDDGTKRIYDWDYTTSVTWSDKRTDYDAANRETYKIYNYDNGNKTTWDYDYTSGVNWKTLERKYNSAGKLYEQTYTYDNGTKMVEKWDLADAYFWYYEQRNYNAAGTLTGGRVQADTGQWGTIVAPVAIDLAGDGVDLVDLSQSGAAFDWEGSDGVKERTAWISGQDGFLVIDLAADGTAGADGVIDQDREIAFTSWAPGTDTDMEALAAAFDNNGDGVLDSRDARWREFRIWQDVNQNGQTDQGELRTLESWGITSIGLDLTKESQGLSDTSMITGTGVVTWSDGRQTSAADTSLAYAPAVLDDLYRPNARIAMSTSLSETFEASEKQDGFLFGQQFGHDTLIGFDPAGTSDCIIFSRTAFADFASVMSAARQKDSDVLIEVNDENSLVLKNVMLASLQADDFRFSA